MVIWSANDLAFILQLVQHFQKCLERLYALNAEMLLKLLIGHWLISLLPHKIKQFLLIIYHNCFISS
ncbi:hypothetical protein D3C81_2342390 [compost metagenome]